MLRPSAEFSLGSVYSMPSYDTTPEKATMGFTSSIWCSAQYRLICRKYLTAWARDGHTSMALALPCMAFRVTSLNFSTTMAVFCSITCW